MSVGCQTPRLLALQAEIKALQAEVAQVRVSWHLANQEIVDREKVQTSLENELAAARGALDAEQSLVGSLKGELDDLKQLLNHALQDLEEANEQVAAQGQLQVAPT